MSVLHSISDRELMQMALRFFDWFYSEDHSVGREDFRATQQTLRERLSQPKWVGLTEDEAIELLPVGEWEVESTLDFAKAIEAKLKEKNT